MQTHSPKILLFVGLSSMPAIAYAQAIPGWLVFAVLSPVLLLLFTVLLGIVSRSWQTGLLHAGLVVTWVLLFILVSNIFTNDYVIWTPLLALAVHAVVVVVLIVIHLVKRMNGRNRNESN